MGNRVNDRERLKKLLALEAKERLRDELFDRLLDGGEEVSLLTYEPMIDAGDFNPNIYIVKEGLIRGTYLDRNNEITAGFALPGTLLISFHSYYDGEPSYYRYEACCPTVVVRIPKAYFDSLARESHEFALWVMSAHQNQLYYTEVRHRLLSGDAKKRLLQLTRRLSSVFPATGNATSIEVGYANFGLNDVSAATVELYADGEKIDQKALGAMKTDIRGTVFFEVTHGVTSPAEVTYQARITADGDMQPANNASEEVPVITIYPNYPTVDDLTATYPSEDGTVINLTWSQPDMEASFDDDITEDFERASAWTSDGLDGWTFIDNDGYGIYGFNFFEVPAYAPQPMSAQSWWVPGSYTQL
ncbi:MAG: Crp/Fnr family transcriptional regulator, partial [Muribaculaceae bacterium]|nr:Crp/Fnr family transcriptional regulator [Muribaculaceae bacterium]